MYGIEVIENIKNKPGCWDSQRIGVYKNILNDLEKKKVGEYIRNYYDLMKTFWAFKQEDKWYALYSHNYTTTSVMSLPDCKLICEEKDKPNGFCPVDYYVPKESNGLFGFVAGCVWGDDLSMKIQYLDLSKISKGIIKRDDRFGYILLPENQNLCDAIKLELDDWDEDKKGNMINKYYMININISEYFRLDGRCHRYNSFRFPKNKDKHK